MRRFLFWTTAVALAIATVAGVAGYALFTRPHVDPLTKADAIVVLGGDQDGRIDYGLELARQGYADTLVIADSYPPDYPVIRRACASRITTTSSSTTTMSSASTRCRATT